MASEDPFKNWLEDFRREVDALAGAPAPPSVAAGRETAAAFSTWWKSEFDSLLEPAPRLEPPLSDPAARPARPQGEPEPAPRQDGSQQEKAALREALERLTRENAALKQQEGFRARAAELDAKMSRAVGGYEAALQRVESQLLRHEERFLALGQEKSFAETACARLEARAQGLEQDLRLACEKTAAAERDGLDARRRLLAAEEELQRLRQAHASSEAAVAELREQASVYRERLVESQEHTGADVALLRQELREFLVKVKRLLDEAAGRAQ